jgi:hypothetical protein
VSGAEGSAARRATARAPGATGSFELIDLHDAPVVASTRGDREIRIELRYVNLAGRHPANTSGKAVRVGPCTLSFHGVVTAEAKLFDDATRLWVAHPTPDTPFDGDIIRARVEPAGEVHRFVLEGMHRAGWSEWHIVAEGVTLAWDGVLGDAWYVADDEAGSG